MDRETWHAAVHGVAKSWMPQGPVLHTLSCHSCFTQIPTPSPLGCRSRWCSRPFHAQLCCFCVLCCSVLLHRRASGFGSCFCCAHPVLCSQSTSFTVITNLPYAAGTHLL